eukprot:12281106-Prorocentrum_lima.AAC.1
MTDDWCTKTECRMCNNCRESKGSSTISRRRDMATPEVVSTLAASSRSLATWLVRSLSLKSG